MDWNTGRISDETYRDKFTKLPHIIKDWTDESGGIAGKEVLDFGCGEATTALGMLLGQNASRVVGIDICADLEKCAGYAASQIGLHALPKSLHLHKVKPGTLHDPHDKFDLIYSWSVFEHVEQRLLPQTIDLLRSALKPNGHLFIQIAPLFYSEDGSHLMRWIPEPWGHLVNQHSVYLEKLRAAVPKDDEFSSLRRMYETLNRITSAQLIHYLTSGGFRVLREYRTDRLGNVPLPLFEVYQRDVLMNEQIVLLLGCA